jgi:predicted nucleic acid-binding protein
VVIGFLAGQMPAAGMAAVSEMVDRKPNISVITQIEVLRFNDTPENEAVLAGFVDSSLIHPLSDAIVRRTIALCKRDRIKLPDAVIAATALCGGFALVTRNLADFKNIPNLSLLNPWDIPAQPDNL